jgi:ATP-binding cassette subfamily B protein
MSKSFPFFYQHDAMNCGVTCFRMVAKYHSKNYTLETLMEKTSISHERVSLLEINKKRRAIKFLYVVSKDKFRDLCKVTVQEKNFDIENIDINI